MAPLHRVTAPLRAALYSRRYGSGFQEFYPEWDSRVQDVRWADEYLEADDRLDAVLDDVKGILAWIREHEQPLDILPSRSR
ncbi:hypothetical protein WJX73_004559 [Symbiochloris irregularis]|uniref:HEPN domain-containing protein n=1 Tax=Symbiochloris irregularis TaxID=706552 RepID=A0AAW1PN51_9CHLO